MMGRQQDDQAKLLYKFCLEDRVASNHLLRKIDRFIDLGELRTLHFTATWVALECHERKAACRRAFFLSISYRDEAGIHY